jgi:ATP-dependent DNA helicase RecG
VTERRRREGHALRSTLKCRPQHHFRVECRAVNLAELLKSAEGKTLEFKRDLSSPEGVLRSLVAFANTAGGVVLIGVEDRTRHVRGVADPLAMEERLANLINDSISPRLLPELDILPWRSTHVLAVQIYPSATRPHFLKSAGSEAGTYVRVGSTNRKADRDLMEELRRFVRGEAYDEQPIPDLDAEAIDFRAASESFAAVRKLKPADLETLRLMTTCNGRQVPTAGGVLLFGRQRETYFPDAWIQAGKFEGMDRSHVADHAEIRLPLPQAVDAAIGFVQKHNQQSAEIGAARRIDRWLVPPTAVREAVINAVAHADYSQRGAPIRLALYKDRVEIENPGLLPFGLTVDDLRSGISKLRNRVIGRVFHELGLIEQWGSGIQRMTAACRDAGLADPMLEEIGTRFRVTIRTSRIHAVHVDEVDQRILDVLAKGEGRSTAQVSAAVKLSPRATRTRLLALVGRGIVREVGTSPQDPGRRYFLAAAQDTPRRRKR